MAWQQLSPGLSVRSVYLHSPGPAAFVPYHLCLWLHFFLDWLHDSGERGVQPLKHIKGFKDLWFGVRKGRWGIQ